MYSRAAEIFGGFCRQTPPLSFTQNVTAYQFLGPYVIVLPRPESFGVGHFIYILALKWPTSRLSGRGKMKFKRPKNCYAATFWVKLNGGVCLQNPPKISAALLYVHQSKSKHFIAKIFSQPFMVLHTFLKSMP